MSTALVVDIGGALAQAIDTAITPFGVPGDWILQGGAVGLLAFVALMVFLGWLVPARTYRVLERDRDYWREVALKAMGHTDALMPAAQIASQVTQALTDATSTAVGQALAGNSTTRPKTGKS